MLDLNFGILTPFFMFPCLHQIHSSFLWPIHSSLWTALLSSVRIQSLRCGTDHNQLGNHSRELLSHERGLRLRRQPLRSHADGRRHGQRRQDHRVLAAPVDFRALRGPHRPVGRHRVRDRRGPVGRGREPLAALRAGPHGESTVHCAVPPRAVQREIRGQRHAARRA